jgi:GNAT superfamily N-acetyltransferase
MSELRIRAIEKDDVPRVWELLRGLAQYEKLMDALTGTPEMLRDALFGAGPKLEGLVADKQGTLVGYALFYPVFGSFRTRWRLWLEDLYVEPSERGTGTGAALMAELSRIAIERGFYAVDWEVIDWNEPALRFYQSLGSNEVATDWLRYRLTGEALQSMADRTRESQKK